VLIIKELIKGTSVLMFLMLLIVLTSQSFNIKEEWFLERRGKAG
jgi:hypothetical protein